MEGQLENSKSTPRGSKRRLVPILMIIIEIKILVLSLTTVILIAINNNKKYNVDSKNPRKKNHANNVQ